ncbi:MAG: efflux RND transporter periplasmic adaptor subunit [Candidatus Eisenbacteria bacterium]
MSVVSNLTSLVLRAAVLAIAVSFVGCAAPKDAAQKEGGAPDSLIRVSPAALASGEIKLESIALSTLADSLTLQGEIQPEPLRLAHVAPRVAGTVQSVRVVPGDHVARGQVVATLYSPEYLAAQGDFLLAHRRVERARVGGVGDLASFENVALSAQRRLEVLGATGADIARLHQQHEPSEYLSLRSPLSGVVTEVEAVAGKHVEAGADLFGVADLSVVWAVLSAHERDLERLRPGQIVRVVATAYPSLELPGQVTTLGGVMDEATRTLQVRVRVPNHGQRLKPGMFVSARVATGAARPAIVLSEAAVQDLEGKTVVFVVRPDSGFLPRVVEVRARGGGLVEVTRGLGVGERVATIGAFLIKSQALKGQLGEE